MTISRQACVVGRLVRPSFDDDLSITLVKIEQVVFLVVSLASLGVH